MGARVGLVVIGLWTLLQSLLYGAFAVAAALAHRCELQMSSGQFEHLFYTWYLRDSACGPTNWELLAGQTIPADQQPSMPPVSQVALRTDIIAIVYFALSCAWLLASIGLLMSVSKCCTPKRTLVYGWVAVTALVSALDVAASGVFLADLIRSLTMDAFLNFEITLPPQLSIDFMPKYLLVVPSAVMLAVATRGIVFWIMNVVLLFLAVAMARRSIFKDSEDNFEDVDDITHYSRNNNNLNKHTNPDMSNINNRFDDQAPRSVLDNSNITSSPYLAERRYFEPLKGGDGRSQSPSHEQAPTHSSKIPIIQGTLLEQQRITIDRPHLRSSRTPDSASLRSAHPYRSSIVIEQPESRQMFAATAPQQQVQQVQQVQTASAPPPDELRGQLPWSYFKSRNDITGPKRTFTHLRDDEDLPPVPVPDYTLHFPRNVRPSTNSSDEGAWTGPEQRY